MARAGPSLPCAEALVAASFVHLYFLSCRSAVLALGIALVGLLAAGCVGAASLFRMLAGGTVVVVLLVHYGPRWSGRALHHPLSEEVMTGKAATARIRLAVWTSTLQMIRDQPFGVGSGSFGNAFIPYQLGIETIPGETVRPTTSTSVRWPKRVSSSARSPRRSSSRSFGGSTSRRASRGGAQSRDPFWGLRSSSSEWRPSSSSLSRRHSAA